MKKQNRNGSAGVIIVIVCIVAIISVLAFVFLRQTKNQSDDSKNKSPATSSQLPQKKTVALKEARVDSAFPAPLSWSYPENWSISNSTQGIIAVGQTGEQVFTLTSPSGSIAVSYLIGIGGGRGGTCSPEYAGTIQYIREEQINGLALGRFVESINDVYDTTSGTKNLIGYSYHTDIYPNTRAIQNATVGSSVCVLGLSGVTLEADSDYMLLGATVTIKGLKLSTTGSGVTAISDISSIKNAFNTEEYKQATDILLSTKFNS